MLDKLAVDNRHIIHARVQFENDTLKRVTYRKALRSGKMHPNMIMTTNVFHRVFQIRYGSGTATCFTIDVDSKQYIVTARHVVDGIKDFGRISIWFMKDWIDIDVSLVGFGEGDADVAVLSAKVQLSPQFDLEATAYRIAVGQDVYFLGFPYGMKAEVGVELNRGFPAPLVKKGILSSFGLSGNPAGPWLLDGHNNDGFSGGPVVFEETGRARPTKLGEIWKIKFRVAAVISAYHAMKEPFPRLGGW